MSSADLFQLEIYKRYSTCDQFYYSDNKPLMNLRSKSSPHAMHVNAQAGGILFKTDLAGDRLSK